jgi:hypothetical protein
MSCIVCSNPGDKLCGGCRSVSYCSKQCLVNDWKNGHKHTCAALPKKMNNIRLQHSNNSELTTESPGFISVGENLTSVLSKYTNIKLNSAILLQLLAYCDNEKEIPVILGSGILYIAAIINKITGRDNPKNKQVVINKFYVFKPKSMFVTKIANKYGCEPIWLYGPDSNNMFLSITKNTINPIKKPIQFWRNEYISILLGKITELGDNSTELSVLYKMNSFDDMNVVPVCEI